MMEIEINDNTGPAHTYIISVTYYCVTRKHYQVHYGHNGQIEVMMFYDGNCQE